MNTSSELAKSTSPEFSISEILTFPEVVISIFPKFCPQLEQATNRDEGGVDVAAEITPWLISAFGEGFAPSTVGRIWDVFFHEKEKALHRFILAILEIKTASILAQDSIGTK